MYGLFWELHQTSHITGAEREAARASEQATHVTSHVHELEARIDKLTLISMALWSLLQQVSDLTEEDLVERVSPERAHPRGDQLGGRDVDHRRSGAAIRPHHRRDATGLGVRRGLPGRDGAHHAGRGADQPGPSDGSIHL